MLLQSMLRQERLEHSQLTSSVALMSYEHNLVWRKCVLSWYHEVVDSVENFDGSRGTFDSRTLSYTALKILDIYLSSSSPDFQEEARSSHKCYKLLAIVCLYIAMIRSKEMHGKDRLIVQGKIMPQNIFLTMCRAEELTLDDFSSTIKTIVSFLDQYNCLKDGASPLVSAHFFDIIQDHILEKYPNYSYEEDIFVQAEILMYKTVGDIRFSCNPPSLNTLAAYIVAFQDIDHDVITSILSSYIRNGGTYEPSNLQDIVSNLGAMVVRVPQQQLQQEMPQLHVIPE